MTSEFKLVPVTPTEEMKAASHVAGSSGVWSRMLAAAPQPPALGGELKCWSCKAIFSLQDRQKCDGCCWKCGVEIELDDYVAPLLAEIEQNKSDTQARLEWAKEAVAEIDRLQGIEGERDTLKALSDEAIEIILQWKAIFGESMARKCELYIKTDEFLSKAVKDDAPSTYVVEDPMDDPKPMRGGE